MQLQRQTRNDRIYASVHTRVITYQTRAQFHMRLTNACTGYYNNTCRYTHLMHLLGMHMRSLIC